MGFEPRRDTLTPFYASHFVIFYCVAISEQLIMNGYTILGCLLLCFFREPVVGLRFETASVSPLNDDSCDRQHQEEQQPPE